MSRRLNPYIAFGAIFSFSVIILFVEQLTHLDMLISKLFYNESIGLFLWQDDPLGQSFYQATKELAIILALGLSCRALYFSTTNYSRHSQKEKQAIYFIVLIAFTEPVIVWLFREYSMSYCPVDLVQFGGENIYYHLLDVIPPESKAGQCNPSGHASSFMWLPSLFVLRLQKGWPKAIVALVSLVFFALILSFVQVIRGEHFFSHLLWSAAIALTWCFIILYSYRWKFLKII
jgi:membrane-associated PAP2 superfamily phosphatase